IYGYATGNHVDQVNAMLEQDASLKEDAIYGYARGDHIDQVNAMLEQDEDDSLKEEAVSGYLESRNINQAILLFKQGASADDSKEYDSKKIVDLFQSIGELKKYAAELHNQGHSHKGKKADALAQDIRKEVIKFLLNTHDNDTASKNLSKLMTEGRRTMGEDRH